MGSWGKLVAIVQAMQSKKSESPHFHELLPKVLGNFSVDRYSLRWYPAVDDFTGMGYYGDIDAEWRSPQAPGNAHGSPPSSAKVQFQNSGRDSVVDWDAFRTALRSHLGKPVFDAVEIQILCVIFFAFFVLHKQRIKTMDNTMDTKPQETVSRWGKLGPLQKAGVGVLVLIIVGCIIVGVLAAAGVFSSKDPAEQPKKEEAINPDPKKAVAEKAAAAEKAAEKAAAEKAAAEKAAAEKAAAEKAAAEIAPKLKLTGPDVRISGDFELQSDKTVGRKHYDEANWDYPNGAWSNQVWKHTSKPCYIYDHNETASGNHTWCIGPWNSLDGGAINTGRYAYIYVDKETVDTEVAKYKESQTSEVLKYPLKSWDVMQFGWFHNGWDWTEEAQKGTGGITLAKAEAAAEGEASNFLHEAAAAPTILAGAAFRQEAAKEAAAAAPTILAGAAFRHRERYIRKASR